MAIYNGNAACLHHFQQVSYSVFYATIVFEWFFLVIFRITSYSFFSKLESRKYPTSMKVTIQNVMGFILSNLSRRDRLIAIASIAKYRNKQKQSIENTIGVLRRETEDNIITSLRDWRLNPRKRNYILRRIQALRHLYLTLHIQAYKRDFKNLDDLIKEVSLSWIHDVTVQ